MSHTDLIARLKTCAHRITEFSASRRDDARAKVILEAVDAIEILQRERDHLKEVALEYDRCIRHMDAGGDFHEFQAQAVATNQRGGD